MRFAGGLIAVMSLVLVGGDVRAQEAVKPVPATRPAQETIAARCVVRVRWDNRLSFPHLESVITAQRATREAAQKLLGVDKPVRPGVSTHRSDANEIDLTLDVSLDDVPGVRHAAAEYMEALTSKLAGQLEDYQKKVISEEVRPMRERADRAERNLQMLRAELDERRSALRKATGRADAVQNWADVITGLEQEREKLALDLAGQQARRQAIEKTIATISKQAEERAKEDPIAVEFAKIVELRLAEAERMRLLHREGRISQTEISDVDAKAADARARLLERRELSMRGAGGELLGELNRELMMLSINAAEHGARLELILARLDRFHGSAGEVDRIKQLERDLETLESEHREARKQAMAHEDRYRNVPAPAVTVLECRHVTPEEWQRDPQLRQRRY